MCITPENGKRRRCEPRGSSINATRQHTIGKGDPKGGHHLLPPDSHAESSHGWSDANNNRVASTDESKQEEAGATVWRVNLSSQAVAKKTWTWRQTTKHPRRCGIQRTFCPVFILQTHINLSCCYEMTHLSSFSSFFSGLGVGLRRALEACGSPSNLNEARFARDDLFFFKKR